LGAPGILISLSSQHLATHSTAPGTARLINPPSGLLGCANAVLTGTSRRYQTPDFEGCLSIKAVMEGNAVWQVGGRRFAVDPNCFLILNDRQRYTITIDSARPATTFCMFFQRGFVEDIWRTTVLPADTLLDTPQPSISETAGFFERLEPGESSVLAEVRRFHRLIGHEDGVVSWHERFNAVAVELVQAQHAVRRAFSKLPALRSATKAELCRRLLRGRDLLLSAWSQPLRLQEIAAQACLSPYHFHRSFTAFFGQTPHRMLTDYRLARTEKRLREGDRSIIELCLDAGFESPASFSHLFRRRYGMSPLAYRQANGCAKNRKIRQAPRRSKA
jgi:AraC-like DNA-binding protein